MAFSYTQVPLYQETLYRYNLNLEGAQRTFVFYWNEREGSWHFNLSNQDGTSVIKGQKLVAAYPMCADLQLDAYGLTGYFMLLPNNAETVVDPTDSSVIPQFFRLDYIYEVAE